VEVLPPWVRIGDTEGIDLANGHRNLHVLPSLSQGVSPEGNLLEIVVLKAGLHLAEAGQEGRLGPDRKTPHLSKYLVPGWSARAIEGERHPLDLSEIEPKAGESNRLLDVGSLACEFVRLNKKPLNSKRNDLSGDSAAEDDPDEGAGGQTVSPRANRPEDKRCGNEGEEGEEPVYRELGMVIGVSASLKKSTYSLQTVM
jgi:hypothetical protein